MEIKPENAGLFGADRCPHLGLSEDPQTSLSFPSLWNYCHRAHPAESVALAHQRSYCQSAAFGECPLAKSEAAGPLPPEARNTGHHSGHHHRRRIRRRYLALMVLGLLLLGVWLAAPRLPALSGLLRGQAGAPGLPVTSATMPAPSPLPAAALATEPAPSAAPAPSRTAQPTRTAEATLTAPAAPGACGAALDQPIGSDPALQIHKVMGGENLNMYADQYETSVEAIQQINHRLPIPMHVGWMLVIPVGASEVGALPPFEPFQALEPNLTLEGLAALVGSDPKMLRQYNDWPEGCASYSGWILVPRPLPAPTATP